MRPVDVLTRKGAVAAIVAMALAVAPLSGGMGAARVTHAAGIEGVAPHAGLLHARLLIRPLPAGVLLAPSRALAATAATSAPSTPTTVVTMTPAATATTAPTTTNTPRPTRTPRPTSTPRPTRTPRPTATTTPRPTATTTPRFTRTPRPTATPAPPTVKLLSVGAYEVQRTGERRVKAAALGTPLRLKIEISVQNFPNNRRVHLTAAWELRGALRYQRDFTLGNGRAGLYDDIVLPRRDFVTGSYFYTGSIRYSGHLEQATTMLHVVGASAAPQSTNVHYAHLRLTVPEGWILDFTKSSSGQPATGTDTLTMFSPTQRTAIAVITALLRTTPGASDLRAFVPVLLGQLNATNVKTITYNAQIDGHDVFAAQGDVTVNGRTSHVIAIVTNKDKRLYAFLVVNRFGQAPQSEIDTGLTAIFGSRLD